MRLYTSAHRTRPEGTPIVVSGEDRERAEVGQLSVAESVADELATFGIDRVFGLPGGEVLALIDALRHRGVEYVVCRHEANAGIMAAVYGKLKGTVGVVLTTLGPGACNLMLPIANSLLDREPLLAISAQVPASWPTDRTHQRLPLLESFGPLAKFSGTVHAMNCRSIVRAALMEAGTEPHGPSYLCLSAEEASRPAGERSVPGPGASLQRRHLPLQPVEDAVKKLSRTLAQAERPMVVVGAGMNPANSEPLRRWIREWNLPVAVTPKCKGVVDELCDHFVGVVGGVSIDSVLLGALRRSDCLIGFGLDPAEIDGSWHTELPLTWILDSAWATDLVPGERLIPVDHATLLDKLALSPPRDWQFAFTKERDERRAVMQSRSPAIEGVSPTALVADLAAAMPRNTVVATDVGAHKYVFAQFWPSCHPQTYLVSNGLSGMGYGLPAAIAAKLARPDAPVLAVLGDGAFSMNSQELETARRLGTTFATVVLADQSYALIQRSQQRRGLVRCGVDFGRIDSVLTAQACGILGVRAGSTEEAAAAVALAYESGESVVVEVPISVDSYDGLV